MSHAQARERRAYIRSAIAAGETRKQVARRLGVSIDLVEKAARRQRPEMPPISGDGPACLITKRCAEVLIDACDLNQIMLHKWHVYFRARTSYAASKIDGKTISLQAFLMKPPAGFEVDHIDCNGLNNQRSNLRICTRTENALNRRRNANRSHPKGAFQTGKRFTSHIGLNGRVHYLGTFDTAAEAHAAYRAVAEKLHGEFARFE